MTNTQENTKAVVLAEREVFDRTFTLYGTVDEPLFLAKDVAEMIDYSKSNVSKMLSKVDENEKVRIIVTTLGGLQESWFLTEDGLYEVLMQSRKPIAKQFKTKVKEILKSIRKHGAYMTAETIEKTLTDPDFIIRLATQLKAEQLKSQAYETKLIEQAPKVATYDAYMDCKKTHSFTDVGKVLGLTATDIIEFLCRKGILMRNIKNEAYPTKGWLNTPYFKLTLTSKYMHTRVTPKGFSWLKDLLEAEYRAD